MRVEEGGVGGKVLGGLQGCWASCVCELFPNIWGVADAPWRFEVWRGCERPRRWEKLFCYFLFQLVPPARWAERPSCAAVDEHSLETLFLTRTRTHTNTNLQSPYLTSLFTTTRPHCFLPPSSLHHPPNSCSGSPDHHSLASFLPSLPPSSLVSFTLAE